MKLTEPRTLAPPAAADGARDRGGAPGRLPRDPRARRRRARTTRSPGQFYMLSTRGAVGRGRRRAALPAPGVLARARARGRAELPARGRRPRHRRGSRELHAGEGLALVGPLGVGWRPPREGTRPLLVGGGIGAAPLLCLAGRARPGRAGRCSASAPPPTPRPPRCSRASPRWRPTTARPGRQALVTDLLREQLDADAAATVFACGPPAMLEAVRLVCAERAVPAQLALESGMACGFGACFGCVVPTREGYVRLCVDGPVLDADQLEAPCSREPGIDRALRRAARRPGPERLRHVRRDRRPARLRRRPARALPLPRLRLEDDHARAARGQPAAAAVGDARRADQLDRPAQQGPRGLPGARPARAGRPAGAADRVRDGLQPRRARHAGAASRGARRGGADRAERVLPERRDRAW